MSKSRMSPKRAYTEALHRIEECGTNGESLDLSNLGLLSIPPEIGQLAYLRTLDLQFNLLDSLPIEIVQLANLRVLHLGWNQLTVLRPEIGQLSKLTDLNLNSNDLVFLPPQIGQLSQLARLRLESNRLGSLPPEINQLSNLSELFLTGNADLELPRAVLGPGRGDCQGHGGSHIPAKPREILDYYFAAKDQGEAPMQELRVLLVGRGRVGKTSLLKALQREIPNPKEPETPGISVQDLELFCNQGRATAHVWDFGGQEFLHGTHQIFLSERCVYILVLEGRDGNWETETDYWLRFIQSFGGESPVIVALNKYDDHVFSVDRHRLKERCPQIAGFVTTDALTGRGVEELRELLEATANEMRDVWLGVPRKWHRIKEALESMTSSFVSYEDYQKLCTGLEVPEARQQDSLAAALHRLGIALNFRDHHRLNHTSVLKPAWVTEAIYGLIRFTQQMDCHGVLDEASLPEALLPAANYPASLHEFVVSLMEKFEVAFLLGETPRGRQWLIPELLGEEQPDAFSQFRCEGAQQLRFSYPDALPPGLLPRLIVRTRDMSDSRPRWRWRSGVVLEWGGCQALVRLDRLERKTEMSVIGGSLQERQSMFDIIRAHLVVLHGNVRAVEEMELTEYPDVWMKVAKLRSAERKGTETLEEYIDEETEAEVVVSKELDQVESDAATEATRPEAPRRMHLFVSYAHADEKEILPFRQHLTLLSQQGYIQIWNDRDLVAGELWETGIMEELTRAEIVLYFHTTGAKVSAFIREKELPVSLDRSDRGECSIVWVPLERNDLSPEDPIEKRLGTLQCATRDAQYILSFERSVMGWMQVENSIRRAVEKRRKAKKGDPDS